MTNGVVLKFNRRHKAGTEPDRLHGPATQLPPDTPPRPDDAPSIAIPTKGLSPRAVALYTDLFSAFIALSERAGLNLAVPQVRRDFIFGLHCILAAFARQGNDHHSLHQVLDGQQLALHVPKYLAEHTPSV